MSTPPSLRGSTTSLPLPSPSPLARNSTDDLQELKDIEQEERQDEARIDPLAGVPELVTFVAEYELDRYDGLKLVADSVAQQRQVASRALISHPVNLAVFVAVLAAAVSQLYKTPADLPLVLTTFGGLSMVGLVAVRYLTGRYIFLAESINWEWLGDDTLLITKFGDQVIGALVLAWVSAEGKRRRKGGRGSIRAWTVKLKYRGKGVGTALLEEAAKLTGERGGECIEFAEDHARRIPP